MRVVSSNPFFFFIGPFLVSVLKDFTAGITGRYFELVSTIVNDKGYEVYDLDFIQGSCTLRLFIRKISDHSADIEDCVEVDRALTEPIQNADWIPDNFTLEVSSPGVYRQLVKREHFSECAEARVEVVASKKLGDVLENCPSSLIGVKKFFARIKKIEEMEVEFEVEKPKENIKLAFDKINKVHLEPHFDELMAKSERMET